MAQRSSLEAICEVHQTLPCLEACLVVEGVPPKEHVKHRTRELPAAPGAGVIRHPIPQVARSDHCIDHSILTCTLNTPPLNLQSYLAQPSPSLCITLNGGKQAGFIRSSTHASQVSKVRHKRAPVARQCLHG